MKTIRATFRKGTVPVTIGVVGWVSASGLLGVHRSDHSRDKTKPWGVTHIPTGHLILTAKTRKLAFAGAALLEDLDWNFKDPQSAAPMTAVVVERLQPLGLTVSSWEVAGNENREAASSRSNRAAPLGRKPKPSS